MNHVTRPNTAMYHDCDGRTQWHHQADRAYVTEMCTIYGTLPAHLRAFGAWLHWYRFITQSETWSSQTSDRVATYISTSAKQTHITLPCQRSRKTPSNCLTDALLKWYCPDRVDFLTNYAVPLLYLLLWAYYFCVNFDYYVNLTIVFELITNIAYI